jgi:hypothetical protein
MNPDKRVWAKRLPAELSSLIRGLEAEERAKIEALFETALTAARDRSIIDLWSRPELASTYWILAISDVTDPEESAIAEALLKWRAFTVKDSALVECLQMSDRDSFKCCAKAFDIARCPSLVVGCSPEMSEYVRFGPKLIRLVHASKTFHRFLAAVHAPIESRGALRELRTELLEERFWADLEIPSSEAKGLFFASPNVSCNTFDVFLSHNSKDKSQIRKLAELLSARGLRVWLDESELIPGRPWQEELEHVIESARTAIVAVGDNGLGPWETPELRGCLSQFVDRKLPVIPVLLPGTGPAPELPLFLKQFTWVDLRGGWTRDAIDKLEWGISGYKSLPPR